LEDTTVSKNGKFETFVDHVAKGDSLSDALEMTEQDLNNIAGMAAALYKDGKVENALRLLEGLRCLRPDKAEYWSASGAALVRLERYQEALPILSVALKMNGKDIATLVNRGECYLALADNEKAAKDLEAAIDLDPQEKDPAANRARQLVFAMYTFFEVCSLEALDTAEVTEN
jgi:tetratricopeptide (TPR) repeat protein